MATEKRLIEVETVIEKIRKANCADCYSCNGVLCRACLVDDFISLLDDSPTVDAVEVVRCKDCKNYFYSSFSMGMRCRLDGTEWGKDDFCSCGERKDK